MACSRFLNYSFVLSLLILAGCRKETENLVVRYEITSSGSNQYLVSYNSDKDVEQQTRSVIPVAGGYWTVNHIGERYEPYFIEVSHDTSSKPPYRFELYIIANGDTVEHRTDTTRFEKIRVKGRKL